VAVTIQPHQLPRIEADRVGPPIPRQISHRPSHQPWPALAAYVPPAAVGRRYTHDAALERVLVGLAARNGR
jgi:hypothetical protein